MAHPGNMPSIGDPVKEKDSVPGASGLYASTLEQDWWRKSVQPHCPIRRHFAHLLTLMCLDLIVLHEYAHLTNGHVDYLDQVPDKDEPRRRQALEINADATSVLNILASTCAQHVLLRNKDPHGQMQTNKPRERSCLERSKTVFARFYYRATCF